MLIKNSIANIAGQLLYPILSVILVPFYIHYLGIEGYGLVGFFTMLVALLGVFTKGLGSALQREFAQRDGSVDERPSMRRLFRTFELVYWAIGLISSIALASLTGFISMDWVQVESISPNIVRICLLLISLRITLAFPSSVYQAVFVGTQRQVLGNTLISLFVIANAVSGIIIVLLTRSVIGFYANDLINAIWNLFLLRYWASKSLPPTAYSLRAVFDLNEIKRLWSISVDLIWTNGIGLVVTQIDRFFLSSLMSIASLGVYTAGVAGGRLLSMFYNPFLQAVYPQTCHLAQKKTSLELGYHLIRNAKVILIVCMTFGLPIAFFSRDILKLWTRSETVAREGALVMSIYVIGNIFISLAGVFYQGQMALGETRYGVRFNTIALLWYPLVMWYLIKTIGLNGAAWAWSIYGTTTWLYNIIVTRVLLGKNIDMILYLRLVSLVGGIGIALMIGASFLATSFFPNWIWGHVLVASLGVVSIGIASYILCFGFRLPRELTDMLKRLRLALS